MSNKIRNNIVTCCAIYNNITQYYFSYCGILCNIKQYDIIPNSMVEYCNYWNIRWAAAGSGAGGASARRESGVNAAWEGRQRGVRGA